MATHSSILAWRIPGMGEPGGLPSVGSRRVRALLLKCLVRTLATLPDSISTRARSQILWLYCSPKTYVILKKDQSYSGCSDIKRTASMFPFDTFHRVLAIPLPFSSPELSPSQHSCPEVRHHRPTPGPSHVPGPLHQSGEPYMEPLDYFYIFF